jgi:putative membrane protein
MALLNETESERVAEAVARAEKNTAGELVVVVTDRSDDYGLIRAALSLLLSLGVTQEAHYLWPEQPFRYLLLLLAAVCSGLYWLLGHGPLVRLIVPEARRAKRVNQRALQAFAEEGVSNTRDRSGVLVFLSEAEHRVVLLADPGIDARVDKDEWQSDGDSLVAAIERGEAGQGLVVAIERIGGILAEAFPPRANDENELPDEVRRR